ncbi:MAG TPA: hypothetical protein VHK69_00510 [Chitinophagaceae bacterium]|nr:hypothetical protein [Chitinophagaceae bacterium]
MMYSPKRVFLAALCATLLFSSCQKEVSTENPSGGQGPGPGPNPGPTGGQFEAKINGTTTRFALRSATLLRSVPDDLKRMDITGESEDGTLMLILTIGDAPAAGNGVSVRDYIIDLFNEDDPDTPEDESAGNDDGFITIMQKQGNNTVTDVYAETGITKVTACDPAARKVTGTFSATLKSQTGGTDYTLTEGRFTNIPYVVLN